jgi:CHAD domain-containing protein
MKLATKDTVKIAHKNTTGNWAYQAIEKYFEKTIKWEKSVKKDEDAEALHQMRVGMRRLRTAVSRFGIFLSLPKSVSEKNIAKIARTLGSLRDLDVQKDLLENDYQPYLPKQEQKSLHIVFTQLAKHREIAANDVQNILKHELYKSFKHELQEWLDKPIYQNSAFLPIQQVLSDLLLPEVSQFFLHPGWLIGTKFLDSDVALETNWTSKELEFHLESQGEILHSLRKQAKRLRYQMELFSNLYSEDYSSLISEVKEVQEILGLLQDSVVLNDWLENIFKSDISNQLGRLNTLLMGNRYQLWQQWQPLQAKFLNFETKQNFRLSILQVPPSFQTGEIPQ